MWADDHRSTETLFAVVDALAAQGVIGDAAPVIQKESPFFFSFFTHTRHSGLLSLQFLSLGLFEQRPNLGLPFFQLRNILSVKIPGAVDPAANLVDIAGSPAYGCGQLFLLGVIHLDDVAVDCHLAKICAHVFGTELRHLALDEPPLLLGDTEFNADRPCSFSYWIFASFKLQRTNFYGLGGHPKKYSLSYFNGQFRTKTWYLLRKISFHFTTDILFAD